MLRYRGNSSDKVLLERLRSNNNSVRGVYCLVRAQLGSSYTTSKRHASLFLRRAHYKPTAKPVGRPLILGPWPMYSAAEGVLGLNDVAGLSLLSLHFLMLAAKRNCVSRTLKSGPRLTTPHEVAEYTKEHLARGNQ